MGLTSLVCFCFSLFGLNDLNALPMSLRSVDDHSIDQVL